MRRIDPRREDGVAMAEFALIVPVFLLLVIGIISFGRVFFVWNDANHLANETARWAAVDQNPYAPVGAHASREPVDGRCSSTCATTASRLEHLHHVPGPTLPSRRRLPHGHDPEADPPSRSTFRSSRSLDVGFTVRGTSTQRIENLEATTAATAYNTTPTTRTATSQARGRAHEPPAQEERGSVFVLSAFLIPIVFLVLFALVVDTGIWFTHKRQLQNRADAARSRPESSTRGNWSACGSPSRRTRRRPRT